MHIRREAVCKLVRAAQPAVFECPDSLLEEAGEFPEEARYLMEHFGEFIDYDEGRPDPREAFFTFALPCENCGEPCEDRIPAPWDEEIIGSGHAAFPKLRRSPKLQRARSSTA